MKPWVEKYRPQTIEDVVYQGEVVSTLKSSLESHNLPHLLFYGPPGNGKTSTILAICNQLYGPEYFSARVLELNASDERGIDVIRNKVKKFAQISVGQKPLDCKYPLPPFKIIILDEADSMTREAQAALRRTMEKYSKVTRFCLICNYISKIIEPLTSRCAKFRFKPLEKNVLCERLEMISKKEEVEISKETLFEIIGVSVGDLRRAITILQSGKMMYGSKLTSENVKQISGMIPPLLIEKYLESTTKSFDEMKQTVNSIILQGYSSKQFIIQLSEFLITTRVLSDEQKARISIFIAQVEKDLFDGADDSLQLLSLASFIMRNREN